ncbi:glycosyltransferase [Marilutibacter alkalisoli]|uniref:Glycosyltransferase family 4 protein n=1 Tax=Marilutibacter alkalisoli TaxID=2591633 RepID=A0A514BPX8_9GAMM|nr:glycosyltransferase [Lysobacter alkalisoli]QDH69089.1 glycosyltransferase family 4 protein [Lysobacter alkalisoli]
MVDGKSKPGRRRTVAQLLPALESGGVERSTLEIAEALVRAGHRAIVVSAGGRLVPRLEALGAEHITLDIGRKSPLTLLRARALRRLFERERVDLVHARSRLPAWVVVLALRGMPDVARPPASSPRASRPPASRPCFVTTVHGLNSPSRYSAVMTRGERVVCVSATVRDYVLRHYPDTDVSKLRVIPRGIDPSAFPPAPLPDPDARAWAAALHSALDGDGPLLLLPGRGTRLKGHADALLLLAALRGDGLDARLWLPGAREAGRETYIAELEAEAAQLGIADALAFTAPTDAIARAYAASDLVLQLSRKPEAFGRTVIEALSCNRPVLGWAHGGVGELLAELQPVGAVPAFDTDALHRTAAAMLARPSSAAGTMSGYTLHAMQNATLAVYDELLD